METENNKSYCFVGLKIRVQNAGEEEKIYSLPFVREIKEPEILTFQDEMPVPFLNDDDRNNSSEAINSQIEQIKVIDQKNFDLFNELHENVDLWHLMLDESEIKEKYGNWQAVPFEYMRSVIADHIQDKPQEMLFIPVFEENGDLSFLNFRGKKDHVQEVKSFDQCWLLPLMK